MFLFSKEKTINQTFFVVVVVVVCATKACWLQSFNECLDNDKRLGVFLCSNLGNDPALTSHPACWWDWRLLQWQTAVSQMLFTFMRQTHQQSYIKYVCITCQVLGKAEVCFVWMLIVNATILLNYLNSKFLSVLCAGSMEGWVTDNLINLVLCGLQIETVSELCIS